MERFPFDRVVYEGDGTDAALVDNLLVTEGIETIVAPPKDGSRTRHSVYILDEAQLDQARSIVDLYIRGEPLMDPKSVRSWRCRMCNELIEGQFQSCWKCGRAKGSSA
jgi:hypothetical protein